MKPRLRRRSATFSKEDALLASIILKKNISSFFTHLHTSIYGGRIIKDRWKNHLSSSSYRFCPDTERNENGRLIYTEIKATSLKSSQIYSNSKQMSNNLYELLRRLERGRDFPLIEYSLFKYGNRRFGGLHRLNNSQLMQSLAESRKSLTVIPINLFFYMAYFSRKERKNQETSMYNKDSQDYHVIRGRILTRLFENVPFSELHREECAYPELEEILKLKDIRFEHSTTPEIEGHYRLPFTIEPFPIIRYFMPERSYGEMVQNLLDNHVLISEAIGIRDLFQENNDVPF